MIPGQEAKIPHVSWPKNQIIKNRSNIVTNSIKTLKMVHIKNNNNLKKIFKTKQNRVVPIRILASYFADIENSF